MLLEYLVDNRVLRIDRRLDGEHRLEMIGQIFEKLVVAVQIHLELVRVDKLTGQQLNADNLLLIRMLSHIFRVREDLAQKLNLVLGGLDPAVLGDVFSR